MCTHFVPAPAEAAQPLGRTTVALTRIYTRRRPTLSYTYFYDNFDVYGREATWLPHSAAPRETRPRPIVRQVMEAIAASSCPRLGVYRAPRRCLLHAESTKPSENRGAERKATSAQETGGKARLRGSGTFSWPRLKDELLVRCATHVCECRESIEA